MKVIVVDGNDNQIGIKDSAEERASDIHRASGLWLTNSKGEVLMARRVLTKKWDPGCWGPAAAGTIEEGETYESNVVKEAMEEIGVPLSIDQLIVGPKMLIENPDEPFFCQWFLYSADIEIKDLKIERREVMEVRWFTKAELLQMLATHPEQFTRRAYQWIPPLLERTQKNRPRVSPRPIP